ncbi:MAG: hypothetical protein ACLTSG_08040 [Lachnospiraceae bacterium]
MNSMKQLQAQEEVRARREEEARRLRLEQETAADTGRPARYPGRRAQRM